MDLDDIENMFISPTKSYKSGKFITIRAHIPCTKQIKKDYCLIYDENERILETLEEVDMQGSQSKYPSELSGGMKKRVGIARAIAVKPKYILYDEPTTGLDPIMTDSINKLISKLHTLENTTTIIVTHEMRTVYDVTDRVLMLDEGKVRFDGKSDNIKNSNDLIVRNFIEGISDKEFYKN